MLIFVYFFVPETKGTLAHHYAMANTVQLTRPTGVSLEHMGELFGEEPVESKATGEDRPAAVEIAETKGDQRA